MELTKQPPKATGLINWWRLLNIGARTRGPSGNDVAA